MVDVFEEVEEEMRVQRWRELARRYLPWLAAGLLAGLLVAAAIWGWREYQRRGAETASVAYAEGVDLFSKGQTAAAEARFRQVAEGRSPAYKSLALMQLGGARIAAGDVRGGAARFDEAAEAAPDEILADTARLKAVFARMDTQPYPASVEQLQRLAEEGRPYRWLAVEALALARIGAGQAQAARADLNRLSIAPEAPAGSRARAQALIALIDSGAASSLGAVAKAAAALPPPSPVPAQAAVVSGAAPAVPGVQ